MLEQDTLKYVPEHVRNDYPAADFAGPSRTYPCHTQAEVYAAATLYGKADDPAKVKASIIRIAKRKGFALPESWTSDGGSGGKDDSGKAVLIGAEDSLIAFGGAVKATGTMKFGGHLVLHTSHVDPDLTQDFFDTKTDFDLVDGDRRSGYYNHGMDVKIGNHKIGVGTLKRDDLGLWLEAQLSERDEYAETVWKLLEDGALGLSSGALSHLVRRERVGKSYRITHWPVGEWSLTPTPAEPRTQAVPLKMWAKELKANTLSPSMPQDMVVAAISRLNDALLGCLYRTLYAWDDDYEAMDAPDDEAIALVRTALDEHNTLGKRMVTAMLADQPEEAKALLLDAFTGQFKRTALSVATARDLEKALREAGFNAKHAVAITNHGFKGLQRDAEPDEPTPSRLLHDDLRNRSQVIVAAASR